MTQHELSTFLWAAGAELQSQLPEEVAILLVAVTRVEAGKPVPATLPVPVVYTNLDAAEAQALITMLALAKPHETKQGES